MWGQIAPQKRQTKMARNTGVRSVVIAAVLIVLALASQSKAELGCFTEPGPDEPVATCTAVEDCAAVGGTD
jgi:hypothetical protein